MYLERCEMSYIYIYIYTHTHMYIHKAITNFLLSGCYDKVRIYRMTCWTKSLQPTRYRGLHKAHRKLLATNSSNAAIRMRENTRYRNIRKSNWHNTMKQQGGDTSNFKHQTRTVDSKQKRLTDDILIRGNEPMLEYMHTNIHTKGENTSSINKGPNKVSSTRMLKMTCYRIECLKWPVTG